MLITNGYKKAVAFLCGIGYNSYIELRTTERVYIMTKFIKECLASCLEENAADQIMQFIKEKREIRYSQEVKRYYN